VLQLSKNFSAIYAWLLALLLLSLGNLVFPRTLTSYGQQTSRMTAELDRGIELYNRGDFAGATDALQAAVKRKSDDISAWHYLGLTLAKLGKSDEARKAHEKAARLAEALLDQMQTPSKDQLVQAAESAEQFVALSGNLSAKKAQEWRDRASYLRVFAAGDADLKIYSGKEVETKVRVLSKPNPSYTDEARRNQVTGVVVLRCVFAADGRVRAIHVVSGLSDGLNERTIEAARHIKFIPATKDGKPVSMWMELQYNFNLF
jgi:TonB family protein